MITHPFLQGAAPPPGVAQSSLGDYPLFARGKVRDIYDLGDCLLLVATDRLSAFDVVMREPIPGKGIVLTALSELWFERTKSVVDNHYVSSDPADFGVSPDAIEELQGRSMLVRKAQRVDIECVVRGYLAGSGWTEYRKSGVCIGHQLPAGLVESSRLPEPIFTPSTKAESGHDQNISINEMANLVGVEMTRKLKEASLRLYAAAAQHCETRGIILADTKFEFGVLDGRIILIDEAVTPDSSRFWPSDQFKPGGAQPSFDKQYVRDYLDSTGWDHEPPPPPLPEEVITKTTEKYREAYLRLAGNGGRANG